jgi:hypothetical protein
MLPSGMTLNQASRGFKNQGQFIAALHVSQNLGIPFADLKTAMTGIRPVTTTGGTTGTTSNGSTTGTTGLTSDSTTRLSLGQAIQKLRPGVDAGAACDRAEHQASRDVQITTTSSSTTTSATTTTSSTTTNRTTTVAAKPSTGR